MNNDKPYEYNITGTVYGKAVSDDNHNTNYPLIEVANSVEDPSFIRIAMYKNGRTVSGEFHVGTLSRLLEKFREDSWL